MILSGRLLMALGALLISVGVNKLFQEEDAIEAIDPNSESYKTGYNTGFKDAKRKKGTTQ